MYVRHAQFERVSFISLDLCHKTGQEVVSYIQYYVSSSVGRRRRVEYEKVIRDERGRRRPLLFGSRTDDDDDDVRALRGDPSRRIIC